MRSAGPYPGGVESSRPSSNQRAVRWGPAIAYGIPVAVVGGVVWGLVAAVTGYIFVVGALVIGGLVGWAVQKGARQLTGPVIALAAILTLVSVYVGEIVGLSILVAPVGATIVDVVLAYPEIVAEFPSDTIVAYAFGAVGVGYTAYRMWRGMHAAKAPAIQLPTGPALTLPREFGAATIQTPNPARVEVLERKMTRAAGRVHLPTTPPHLLDVSYETMAGAAKVHLDGVLVKKVRVWGLEKVVEVPVSGAPAQVVTVRFHGVSPTIEVGLGGSLIARI